MPHRSSLRASDADREHVAERLRQATAEGRLIAEELEQRLATAFRARTYGELDRVVADLPVPRDGRRSSSSVIPFARPLMAVAIAVVALSVIAFAVLVITGVLAAWGLWMLVAWWAFGGRHHRHHHRRAVRRGQHWNGRAVGGQPGPRAWL
jgi:hypothetical protein